VTLERLRASLADRYLIERELGAGGMATVYLAEDLRHKRKVALKVLKPELAAVLGAERFVQEITTTASLQHPHILPLFDSGAARLSHPERSEGPPDFLYYVMPFIDGETLRSKLDREKQLGVDEAVKLTTEVADALDYAHRQGVIHRDIKPENILLHDGRPMVADFGIALAVSAAAGGRMTETGLSLGTPHYMSPEQATAEKEITARSDVYSLASVLYEMLTGDPPHTGSSAQQIIMKIVTDQARPVTELRKAVPPNVAAALAKALEKLPADRFDSARAFAEALGNPHFALEGTAAAGLPPLTGGPWKRRFHGALGVIALLLVALSVVILSGRRAAPGAETIRFTVTGPVDSTFSMTVEGSRLWSGGGPTVSPDGRHLAFQVYKSPGSVIYLRALDSFDLREVEGESPFFSPTGRELGLLRLNEIWTMALADRVLARAGEIPESPWDIYAAVWHPDGRILVSGARGLWAVPARGGEPSLLVPADSSMAERFGEIELLDDGRLLLNLLDRAGGHIEVVTPDGRKRTPIIPGAEVGGIVGDVLIYSQGGQYRATRLDLDRLEPAGKSVALPEVPTPRLAASIAWVAREDQGGRELVWVSREGRATPLGLPSALYRWPRVSPDGKRIAVQKGFERLERDLVVRDLVRGSVTPLGGSTEPVWSPDGSRVYMSRGNRPDGGLVVQVADGSRPPDTLVAIDQGDAWPTSASPDGRWLAWYGATSGSGSDSDATDRNDLFFMELSSRESRRVRLPGRQRGARFSPDGRWVAYQSTESGREQEVYVRPWPSMDASYRISDGGGTEPIWSRDGRELYYRHGSDLIVVTVAARGADFERGAPRKLFSGPYLSDVTGDQSWDLAPDGRFLMQRTPAGSRATVRVALNWIAEVRERLEAAQ
jgi:Tol biopolymer transport system component